MLGGDVGLMTQKSNDCWKNVRENLDWMCLYGCLMWKYGDVPKYSHDLGMGWTGDIGSGFGSHFPWTLIELQ
jgi:hypothetical protein